MILKIKKRKYDFFNRFQLNLKYDSVASTFSFDCYFNPENKDHRELLHVGHFHPITVEHNEELLVSGILLSETFRDSSVKQLTSLGGYSFPGVLEDCQIPTSIYPLQSDGLSLREIAQKIIRPFNLEMIIDPVVRKKMNAVYDTSTANELQPIKAYLSELASQKNIILSHTPEGKLLFTQANTKKTPIIDFNIPDGGSIPGTSMSLTFNGQLMHSQITVLKQAGISGGNAGEITVTNPFVPFTFRSKVLVQNSGDDNDTRKAAKNALAKELQNIKLKITTDRFEVDEKIIKPDNIVSVINPDIFLFKKTNWFIESINFTGNEKQTTAVLNCVLPEVYNGKTPTNIFEV